MRLLGIDPGTKTTGFCIYRDNAYCTFTRRASDLIAMKKEIRTFIELIQPEYIAIEDFIHRAYLGRVIKTAPEMGNLIGYLEGVFPDTRKYPAEKTKANMKMLRDNFNNDHEYSAYCVANYASGAIKQEN